MTTTSAAPIIATYAPRRPRRRIMRTIMIACAGAFLITLTACICIAIILGTMQAIQTPPQQTPLSGPPAACGIFDDCRVDTSSVQIRH